MRALNEIDFTSPAGYENQDAQFRVAFSLLQEAIARRAFPAASIAVTHRGRLVALKAFGKPVYESPLGPFQAEPIDFPITPETLFDLASLTKVVATTSMAMILYQRGLLELDAPVAGTVPEILQVSESELDSRRRDVTFRMLLAHSSGLPAYEKLFLRARSKDDLLHAAFTMPLTADPGTRAEYSDIGFIILGAALERIAGESLDIFSQREIFGPLGMTHTTFNPPLEMRSKIPPTADEREKCGAGTPARELPTATQMSGESGASVQSARSTFRNRMIQGEVQDENAFVLGGVAAHAGLFSTPRDLARFACAMLGENSIFRPETISLFTRRESLPAGTTRALGWDTPSTPSLSGKYFSPSSFGHLGYTGTSLWIDPERQLSVTLLSNRTWPDCASKAINEVRPKFHDAVVEALSDN